MAGNVNDTPQTSKLAIAALVFSLLFCVPLAPLIGLILGIVALTKISDSQGRLQGRGLAIAAIATGAVMLFFGTGIMLAIAIPNFIHFQMRAKQSEARASLRAMQTGLQALADRGAPEGDTGWVPASPCKPKCTLDETLWDKPPWSDLSFRPAGDHHYQYRYTYEGAGQPARIVISAKADLDQDGEESLFVLTATPHESQLAFEGPTDTTPGKF
jgi:hypothetical protein